jgi:hypothetical protein
MKDEKKVLMWLNKYIDDITDVEIDRDKLGTFWLGELQPLIDSGRVWEIKEQDLVHAGRRN